MLRRSLLCALALCALVSLESCGANRLAGPQVGGSRGDVAGSLGDHPRTDPGNPDDPMVGPVTQAPEAASDSLRTGGGGGDRIPGGRRTDN
jgi:hypothetical protein